MQILNKRQQKILKAIIEKYIYENIAISSLNLNKEINDISSATIRNEMVVLEKMGFLKKEHKSSGRIPTKQGYQIYIETLMKKCEFNDEDIKQKLLDLFVDREENIDNVIDKSIKLISEFLNLPVVLTNIKNIEQELLKKIDIVEILNNNYMILVITSLGEIYKHTIFIDQFKGIEDLSICLRLFNEKLINCPLSILSIKIEEILPELRKSLHQYEFIYKNIILKIFENFIEPQKPIQKIYNKNSIINQPEVKNNTIPLDKIFNFLENYSIFSQLDFNYLKTGKTLINIESNMEGLSVAKTILKLPNNKHELSIVGPTRMNYPLIKSLLDFINEKLIK